MKKLLLITAGIGLLRVTGSAAPCVPGDLTSYIALGSAGCTLGNLQVAGFSYRARAGGGASRITSDEITVTPLLAPTGAYALQFAAAWSVRTGQSQMSDVTYHVVALAAASQVQQVRLDGNGFQAGLFGAVTVKETLASAATTQSLDVYLKCIEVCLSQTSATLSFTPPAPVLVLVDQMALESKLGPVSAQGFTDWFIVCLPCV